MKLTVFVLLALLLGCASDPVQTIATDNKGITVDLLFQHDGCRMYRFEDIGYYHYYAVCGSTTSTSYQVKAGKSSRPDEIQVVTETR